MVPCEPLEKIRQAYLDNPNAAYLPDETDADTAGRLSNGRWMGIVVMSVMGFVIAFFILASFYLALSPESW
jgi:hypothetical protein